VGPEQSGPYLLGAEVPARQGYRGRGRPRFLDRGALATKDSERIDTRQINVRGKRPRQLYALIFKEATA
jgi:hypothetical protein